MYSVEIERSIESFAHCIQKVKNGINDIWDWRISINACGIDYGIYFNFNIEGKELEISNQSKYDEDLDLSEIIDEINGEEKEDEEE